MFYQGTPHPPRSSAPSPTGEGFSFLRTVLFTHRCVGCGNCLKSWTVGDAGPYRVSAYCLFTHSREGYRYPRRGELCSPVWLRDWFCCRGGGTLFASLREGGVIAPCCDDGGSMRKHKATTHLKYTRAPPPLSRSPLPEGAFGSFKPLTPFYR